MAATSQFSKEILACVPHLRAFARGLCRDVDLADDLAQDTVIRALERPHQYTIGTNMKAWLFQILRNQFYSYKRRSWRSTWLDPEVAERTLVASSSPMAGLELDELQRALAVLTPPQREAIILVAAAGLSYDEAAEITGVAAGTVKSRVSRARTMLVALLESGDIGQDRVTGAADLAYLVSRYAPGLTASVAASL